MSERGERIEHQLVELMDGLGYSVAAITSRVTALAALAVLEELREHRVILETIAQRLELDHDANRGANLYDVSSYLGDISGNVGRLVGITQALARR